MSCLEEVVETWENKCSLTLMKPNFNTKNETLDQTEPCNWTSHWSGPIYVSLMEVSPAHPGYPGQANFFFSFKLG